MYLTNIKFGPSNNKGKEFCEELVSDYIASLFHNGQLCGEYFITWTNGILHAHVTITHPNAYEQKFHSEWGIKSLKKIIKQFGSTPEWIMLDDDMPEKPTTYKEAPFLYLFTAAFRWESPIRRGDNGESISSNLIPMPSEVRDDVYRWERAYREYDKIWLGCGELEIPVYKQLATPGSELSTEGRSACKEIEKATNIQTYYFLMRYWGRRTGESNRKCPSCGKRWYVGQSEKLNSTFWDFQFRCEKCRLVSHLADSYDDERHARIGEYKK